MAQTITRVIPDGDYPQRLNDLWTATLAAAEDERRGNALPLLNGEIAASETLAAEYKALKAEAEDDARAKNRVVTMRAIGRQKWRELKKAHPVRVGDDVPEDVVKADRLAGVNMETVEDDLVFAVVIEPQFESRDDFDRWANEDISEGEFQMLLKDAWSLVNVAKIDPKSLPPLQTQSSGGSSE